MYFTIELVKSGSFLHKQVKRVKVYATDLESAVKEAKNKNPGYVTVHEYYEKLNITIKSVVGG